MGSHPGSESGAEWWGRPTLGPREAARQGRPHPPHGRTSGCQTRSGPNPTWMRQPASGTRIASASSSGTGWPGGSRSSTTTSPGSTRPRDLLVELAHIDLEFRIKAGRAGPGGRLPGPLPATGRRPGRGGRPDRRGVRTPPPERPGPVVRRGRGRLPAVPGPAATGTSVRLRTTPAGRPAGAGRAACWPSAPGLRDPRPARGRRDGGRVQGPGRAARAGGRAQVPARRVRPRPGPARPVPPRGPDRVRAQPPAHLHRPRPRRARRPAVHRHGVRRGADAPRPDRRSGRGSARPPGWSGRPPGPWRWPTRPASSTATSSPRT